MQALAKNLRQHWGCCDIEFWLDVCNIEFWLDYSVLCTVKKVNFRNGCDAKT